MNPQFNADDGDVAEDVLGIGYPEDELRRIEEAEEAEAGESM